MYFKTSEIERVVKKNLKLSYQYAQKDIVQHLQVNALDDCALFVHALVSVNGYENDVQLLVAEDEDNQVLDYDCDCPYCQKNVQGCAHIGAVMLEINGLESDLITDVQAQKQQLREEERIRMEQYLRIEEEHRRYEEEKARKRRINLCSATAYLIQEEKERTFRTLSADQSGSVRLRILHARTATYGFDTIMYFQMKIGRKKEYIIKDIDHFVESVKQKERVRYGKELDFVHQMEAFDEESQRILKCIMRFIDHQNIYRSTTERKTPAIDGSDLRLFYELCKELPQDYCEIETREKTLSMKINIYEYDDYIQLELSNMPHLFTGYLDESGLYQVSGKKIIHYQMDEGGKCGRLLEQFIHQRGEILINRSDLSQFSKYIWQDVHTYCETEGNIHLFDLEELDGLKLYGDMDDYGIMSIRVEGREADKIVYGFTDTDEEKAWNLEIVENYIKEFANIIDYDDHVAYLPAEGDSIYSFIKDGLSFLQDYCDIYISDAIMKLGNEHRMHLQVGVRLSGNLLEISFGSREISQNELFDVLRSYQRKRKYHRLKNNQLIYLNSQELGALDEFVKSMHIQPSSLKQKQIKVPAYRAFSLAPFFEQQRIKIDRANNVQNLYSAITEKQCEAFPLLEHYQGILRDYQVQGYQWLKLMNHYRFGAILADDMGLGKTVQVIALLESEKKHGVSLVIAPSSLIYNWKDEIAKFTDQLRTLCILGNASKRETLIHRISDYDVAITSYDYLRRDIDKYASISFHYVILDEAQYIKNQKTKNAQSVKKLTAKHRLALTGTPIENSLAELWSIFDFLMSGYLYSYHYFVQEYEKPIVKEHDEKASQRLKRMVEPFILRRTKKEVLKELPDKVEQTITIAFSEEEQKLYLANLMQASKELQDQLQVGSMDRIQILALLTRLRQICCEPRLLYENVRVPSSKLNACIELCLSLRENHQRILLFSSFTSILDLLEEELRRRHFRICKLTGKNTKEERQSQVKQFQDQQADIFLISLKAGGTGLNLTAAEAVIHYDPWWNISAQNQATDRAYRIGQEKNVQVFQLIMKDSIEEKIQHLQRKKKDLSDMFVENSNGSIATMDPEEIMELFSQ